MTREERRWRWHKIIEQQEASGLSGAGFCREHNICLSRFYHWRRRLKQDSPGGFLELRADAASSRPELAGAGVLIHLNGTLSIELAPGFDSTTLERAVQVLCDHCLGAQPCFP